MLLHLRTNERDEPPIEIAPGESVLVGRQPSAEELSPELAPRSLRAVTAPSPSVSSNHVLVSHRGASIAVTDLDSRNGTWLEVASNQTVTAAPGADLRIHLAPTRQGAADLDGPGDADWSTDAEFPLAVMLSVQVWLDHRGVSARARVERRDASSAAREDTLGRFALDAEHDLLVEAVHTMDARWLSTLRRIARFVERQASRHAAERELGDAGLIVASPAMRRAVQQVVEAADRPGRALLILGPSGVGKEGLAQCYHARSRPRGPFVSRNCAQFQFGKDLVLSELFGAERGAFTGATRTMIGAVELADGGTLFLDELGELPYDVQSVFLRFLDRGEFARAGSGAVQTSDVRLVGASNKDLRAACLEGAFRRDLWFRLAAEVVEVPPLSQRFEDVVAYLKARTRGRDRSLLDLFSDSALDVLRQHTWEGNFRELINFANRLPEVERVDADACRRILAAGALTIPGPGSARSAPPSGARPLDRDWAALLTRAAEAFTADRGEGAPENWKDVKELVEEYVKPLLFAALSGSSGAAQRSDLDVGGAAKRLAVDRATANKQLERYLERFGGR